MKIYCILLDAFPLKQEIIDFSKKHNFKLSTQFTSGIYTIPTMFSMLHGENPNKIIENGISYHGPDQDNNNFFKFLKKNNNLVKILNDNNYHVFIDNFYSYLKIPIGWKYDENNKTLKLSNINNIDNIRYQTIINPNNYKNVKLLTTNCNPGYIWPFQNYHNDSETNKFYNEILNNIKFVQKKEGKNTLYILTVQDYHHISRNKKVDISLVKKIIKRVISLLEKIDFDDPDSLFYIFADHGLGGDELFDLENYYTWALVKDNTQNKNKIQKPFISSCDFFNFILNKTSINPINNIESQDIYGQFDKNRIYYIQDSRMCTSPIACNSVATVKIVNFKDNIPLEILQLTYVRGICDTIKKFYLFQYSLNKDKINEYDYLFDYNFDKIKLFEGSKEEFLDFIKLKNENIKELFDSLITNNPCLYEIKDESKLEKEDLSEINKIREYVKIHYHPPKQYNVTIDNKTVFRYESRDNNKYINKCISQLVKYNKILSKYIKLY